MFKPKIDDIKNAVEQMHNCKASYFEEVAVIEKFGDKTVWDGIVYVFDIESHNKAKQCFAWASPVEGSNKYRYYAVLSVPPIDSPQKAVRASIVQDHRTGKLK